MDANTVMDSRGSLADLIAFNARKRSLPRFFDNLLQSWEECINENSTKIPSTTEIAPIINSMAVHTEELHFSEAVQLFHIFFLKYSAIRNKSESSAAGKEVVYVLAQIFSTFLLHIKVLEPSLSSPVYENYRKLITLTINHLMADLHILFEENEVLLLRSHLLLWNSVGKLKLRIAKNPSLFLFDFMTMSTGAGVLNHKDRVLSLLAFQVLILKIEQLMHKTEKREFEPDYFESTVSLVVKHAHENTNNGASWDSDLNTLSEDNYGTAVWRKLLEFLPIILDRMDHKEQLKICRCFREIILQGDCFSYNIETSDLISVVLLTLKSSYFQESNAFQRTLLSCVWKLDSSSRKGFSNESETEEAWFTLLNGLRYSRKKWFKYEQSTPSNTELNPLWCRIKEVCSCLNQVLDSNLGERAKIKAEVYNISHLIDCLPLQNLLPINQMHCLIGLSTLFFRVAETCQSTKAIQISEEIAYQIITILEGERSIWLFDFVKSGPYLREVMSTIEKLVSREQLSDVPKPLKCLLKHLINLISKNPKVLTEATNYFSEETCLNDVICKFLARLRWLD